MCYSNFRNVVDYGMDIGNINKSSKFQCAVLIAAQVNFFHRHICTYCVVNDIDQLVFCILIQVKDFCEVVQQENSSVVYWGAIKAPKVLADIVEALAGAILEDLQFNLQVVRVVCFIIYSLIF